jgi:hypothetical protein
MSSTDGRRMRRRMERDIKKGILKTGQGNERELNLPTKEDIEVYINKKLKEQQDGMQLQEEQR